MDKKIFTVSETNRYVKAIVDRDYILNKINISGEISTLTKHSSGHYYFSLKDEKCEISCIMFSSDVRNLASDIKNGDKVVVSGRVSVYEERGKYQVYVKSIEAFGLGLAYINLEKLKKKLSAEGLFDNTHKKSLPKYPKKIGVVTSAGGAAIKDIVKIASARNEGVELIVYDALVQGKSAPASIVRGVKHFDAKKEVDLLIVGRGGGSFEDLMAFNDEEVARAIFACSLPVISAVGHERDNAISDLVADVRAATPSDAALIAVPDKEELISTLLGMKDWLDRSLKNRLSLETSKLNLMKSKLENYKPDRKLDINEHKLLERRMRIDKLIEILVLKKESRLAEFASRIEGMYPINNAKNGYVQMYKDGEILKSVANARLGDELAITLIDGEIKAKITEVSSSEEE